MNINFINKTKNVNQDDEMQEKQNEMKLRNEGMSTLRTFSIKTCCGFCCNCINAFKTCIVKSLNLI